MWGSLPLVIVPCPSTHWELCEILDRLTVSPVPCHRSHQAFGQFMERSRFADFLQPFALALSAAGGDMDALQDVAAEVHGMADEVLAQIRGAR